LSLKLLSVGSSELGFTLLIAVVIYIVFEERVKRDEAKGIAAFLYGIETDSSYFRMIEDYIIRCPFYRTGTAITYRFLERHGESYLIDYTIEYYVRNVSKVRQKFRIRGEVDERPIYSSVVDKWTLGVIAAEIKRRNEVINPELTSSAAKSSSNTIRFESGDFVLKSREQIHVRIEHRIQKHDHDMDIWQAVMPCSGVSLRLDWPTEWPLRFAHEAFHPDADNLVPSDGVENDRSWKLLSLQEPFMARHGLRFWWSSAPAPDKTSSVPVPIPEVGEPKEAS
jgi:hypothetical protein